MAVEYRLYVPMAHNDGTPVDGGTLDRIYSAVITLAGGCTVIGPCRGLWRDDDGHVCDEPVMIVSASDTAQHEQAWRNLARNLARELDQQAVYLTVSTLAAEHYIGQDTLI